ncbi:hypothetical protein R1sor_006746 [Riccia sorocarpa]|uniref:Uncharacterized protein n=1 Tax=Riccia sorocarpa TaxID=122646 RepID=A0ABD3HSN4_9MARC
MEAMLRIRSSSQATDFRKAKRWWQKIGWTRADDFMQEGDLMRIAESKLWAAGVFLEERDRITLQNTLMAEVNVNAAGLILLAIWIPTVWEERNKKTFEGKRLETPVRVLIRKAIQELSSPKPLSEQSKKTREESLTKLEEWRAREERAYRRPNADRDSGRSGRSDVERGGVEDGTAEDIANSSENYCR